MSPTVLEAWSECAYRLEALGAKVIDISLAHTKDALSAYYIIAAAEAYSNLSKYDGVRYGSRQPNREAYFKSSRSFGFGREVKRRLLLGSFVLQSG